MIDKKTLFPTSVVAHRDGKKDADGNDDDDEGAGDRRAALQMGMTFPPLVNEIFVLIDLLKQY